MKHADARASALMRLLQFFIRRETVTRTMPNPDSALKDFFKNNKTFAALFNGFFFDNETIIKSDELEPDNTAYAESIKIHNGKQKYKVEKVNKYRDNIRRTKLGYLVILGIEDQSKVHYSMPIRKMLYDALEYSSELSTIGNNQDKTEWTVDERLSGIKKGTKITPIVTVIFYTGEDPWDGPNSLHAMMDMDDKISPFVPDYPLYVIDIGHDEDLSFNNKALDELRLVLHSIYSYTADTDTSIVDNSTLALAGILSGDTNLYYTAVDSKGGEQPLCRALAERDEKLLAAERERTNALIAEKDSEIASLKAELAALKAKNNKDTN